MSDLPLTSGFPARRLRRLRRTPALRRLVAQTTLTVDDLVAPLFVADGLDTPRPVTSLPGVVQHTVDSLVVEVEPPGRSGCPRCDPVPAAPTRGQGRLRFGGPVSLTASPGGPSRPCATAVGDDMVVMADCCLDEFTDHGHCGIVDPVSGDVDNDATVELYADLAVLQAEAGAHVIAPSGMMDGQVAAIRAALDRAGHTDAAVLAYAAKYASALYGPFREAADVTIVGGGDRKGYQQDPRNGREALSEVALDVAEGADMVMVKPALTYLDVVAEVRALVDVPVAAYHVSGEYAMVKAAAERGWIDGPAVALEQITAVKRAGADFVLTYFAGELAEVLHG